MSQTTTLLITSIISFILIIIGALLQNQIVHSEENRGVSVLGFFLIVLILFGIGSIVNTISSWIGTWIIMGFYLTYIVYGSIYTLILWNKNKKP